MNFYFSKNTPMYFIVFVLRFSLARDTQTSAQTHSCTEALISSPMLIER